MIYIKNFNKFKKINEAQTKTINKLNSIRKYFNNKSGAKFSYLIPRFFNKYYPDEHPDILKKWCLDNKLYFRKNDKENINDIIIPDDVYKLEQYHEAWFQYCAFLYMSILDFLDGTDSTERYYGYNLNMYLDMKKIPMFFKYCRAKIIYDNWLIKFFNHSENVKQNINRNYFLGTSNIDDLGVTEFYENPIKEGSCLAYDINDISHNLTNYGIIFRSNGCKLEPTNSNENGTPIVIFIGDSVENMVGFYKDEKTKIFYTLDKTISDSDFDSFKEKVIKSGNISESITAYHGSLHKFDKFTIDPN